MELRLAEIKSSSHEAAFASALRAGVVTRTVSRFAFITWAVEIEGEAPLIAWSEAVDD